MEMFRPLWIEIDLAAFRQNYLALKRKVRPYGIIAAIKQNAYGHGLLPLARELSRLQVDFFAVESIEEAISLRNEKFKEPILILTAVLPQFATAFIKYKLTPTIVDLKFALALNRAAQKNGCVVPVHIKVDTGMGRLGVWYTQAAEFIQVLKTLKYLKLEGIYTHLPSADTEIKYTQTQIERFNGFVAALAKAGIKFKYQHIANSAGLINYPNARFNLVRPGLALYGIKPRLRDRINLKPILALKTKVVFIKQCLAGMTISYGRTYKLKRNAWIATLAVGYADGYQRALSNKAKVLINGKFYPVVGRVCMDHAMIDLGDDCSVKVGDEVVLIGSCGRHQITASDLAVWANTIPYEITSCLSTRIPRIYKNRV